ncbi:hypothetical protein [Paraburkholderia saeva]|uniref:hypothetical protein n=1 Tax=Paraburkholderia saeva TaxID=2777537 RepID=UPI001D9064B1|nr:hypothetical protein [Paraburkholderia saeva]CAG4887729.1 hypothetical protein R52603_00500 [Paraburkholderia saeva]
MRAEDQRLARDLAAALWDASINCDYDAFQKEVASALETSRTLPQQLTPPLRRVLGMMLWETTPIAHAMRAAGRDIPRKCEDEQAVVLHWLLGIVLEHGVDWQKHAAIELHNLTEGMGRGNV